MIGLTAKELELLKFIDARIKECGYAPSFREMMVALGLHSTGRVAEMMQALDDKGYIRRLARRARAIEVLKMPDGLCDTVALHPEVRAAAIKYAQAHGIPLSTALSEAVRAYFTGDKAA